MRPGLARAGGGVLLCAWFALLTSVPAAAVPAQPPAGVEFHEQFLRSLEVTGPDLAKPLDVFSYIVEHLPPAITVFPSEGYYYFSFRARGEPLRGNIRFDARSAGSGSISFAYFYDSPRGDEAAADIIPEGSIIGRAEGLELESIDRFHYRMRWAGRDVKVEIYDAARERADPPDLLADEAFVGPVYDESGIRFSLIFNRRSAAFYYLHNGRFGHLERYSEVAFGGAGGRILIGTASGFAYLFDEMDGRMYLVGVDQRNVSSNSYYDGPFDQLPDRFVDPAELRDMIVKADPSVEGRLGPYGHFLADDNARYAITPYIAYAATAQLQPFHTCRPSSGRVALTECLARLTRPRPAVADPRARNRE